MLNVEVSQPQKNGDLLLVIGSPFGILSPFHFFNRCESDTPPNSLCIM